MRRQRWWSIGGECSRRGGAISSGIDCHPWLFRDHVQFCIKVCAVDELGFSAVHVVKDKTGCRFPRYVSAFFRAVIKARVPPHAHFEFQRIHSAGCGTGHFPEPIAETRVKQTTVQRVSDKCLLKASVGVTRGEHGGSIQGDVFCLALAIQRDKS